MRHFLFLSIGLLHFIQPAQSVITHPSYGDEWAEKQGNAGRFQAVGRVIVDKEVTGTIQLIEIPGREDLNGRIALTARHVAASLKDDSFFCWDFDDPFSAKPEKVFFAKTPLADIALILLEKKVPIAPEFLYKLPLQNNKACKGDLVLAGYGLSGRSDVDLYFEDGHKRALRGNLEFFKEALGKSDGTSWASYFRYDLSTFPTILTGLPHAGDSGAIYGIQQEDGTVVAEWMHLQSRLPRRVTTDKTLINELKLKSSSADDKIDFIKESYKNLPLEQKLKDNPFVEDEELAQEIGNPIKNRSLTLISIRYASSWIMKKIEFLGNSL